MFACKDIFAKPSIPQASEASGVEDAKGLRSKTFLRILYHEAKMFACKDIFLALGRSDRSVLTGQAVMYSSGMNNDSS